MKLGSGVRVRLHFRMKFEMFLVMVWNMFMNIVKIMIILTRIIRMVTDMAHILHMIMIILSTHNIISKAMTVVMIDLTVMTNHTYTTRMHTTITIQPPIITHLHNSSSTSR